MPSSVFLLGNVNIQIRCADFILALDLSKKWEIEIRRPKRKRTLSQNALMHMFFDVIANHTGDDSESVKSDYKDKYLPKVERTDVFGNETLKPKRTSDLDKKEMAEFLDKIQAHAGSFLGCALPNPMDQGREER